MKKFTMEGSKARISYTVIKMNSNELLLSAVLPLLEEQKKEVLKIPFP